MILLGGLFDACSAGNGLLGSTHSCFLPPQPPPSQLQNKLTEARAKLDGPVDPATGRPLYKPQTGRAPYYTRHAPEQGVGEYLYSLQMEKVGGRGVDEVQA
jgi:hypothetical protein